MPWRYITDDHVDAAFGLAADEYMASAVGEASSAPILRLYTYKNYCALVGRFQDIETELNLNFCRTNGIEINRRPTGGGAIFMGSDQLGVALCIPGRKEDTYKRAREVMTCFSKGIIAGLQALGVKARFRRKNDIEVDGRKIAGLGIYRDPSGGLLFHSSILVDMNIPMMLQVLNTAFEKISDKEINTVGQRITTVRKECANNFLLDTVRASVAEGYRAVFKVDLIPDEFTKQELIAIHNKKKMKYEKEDWIIQTPQVKDAVGTARIKTEKGLLDIRLTLAEQQIKALYIRGDFFASETAVADLEGHFRWHSGDPAKITHTVRMLYHKYEQDLKSLPMDHLINAIEQALFRAKVIKQKQTSEPYGCFVTPGGKIDA